MAQISLEKSKCRFCACGDQTAKVHLLKCVESLATRLVHTCARTRLISLTAHPHIFPVVKETVFKEFQTLEHHRRKSRNARSIQWWKAPALCYCFTFGFPFSHSLIVLEIYLRGFLLGLPYLLKHTPLFLHVFMSQLGLHTGNFELPT